MLFAICLLAALSSAAIPHYDEFLVPMPEAHERNGRMEVDVTTELFYHIEKYNAIHGLANSSWDTTKDPLNCGTYGACDNPTTRDSFKADTTITIRSIVTVVRSSSGQNPDGVDEARVDEMMKLVDDRYAPYGIKIILSETRFVNDADCYDIAAYSQFNTNWLNAINSCKGKYNTDASSYMNVLVMKQKSGFQGTLLGIGSFPWGTTWNTAEGGLWMNSIAFAPTETTFEHEYGHNIGLWHTFHGSDEISGCSQGGSCTNNCCETWHTIVDPLADLVGDYCKDTPATNRHWTCSFASGTDCQGNAWGTTDFGNFMSYSPCRSHLTEEQVRRAHCWSCNVLGSNGATQVSGCP